MNWLGKHPNHSIHHVESSAAFLRWLTMTAQPASIAGLSLAQIRQILLDNLYEDWQYFHDQTIEQRT